VAFGRVARTVGEQPPLSISAGRGHLIPYKYSAREIEGRQDSACIACQTPPTAHKKCFANERLVGRPGRPPPCDMTPDLRAVVMPSKQ
jgi:hypothetical protein